MTALIQSGVNAKVAQTLAGHHSASFTLDQYADAVPQQLEQAGEKVSTVLLEASGSILGAEAKRLEVRTAQVLRYQARPERLRAGCARSSLATLGTATRCARGVQPGSRTRRVVELPAARGGVGSSKRLTARNSPRTPYCFRVSRARRDSNSRPSGSKPDALSN